MTCCVHDMEPAPIRATQFALLESARVVAIDLARRTRTPPLLPLEFPKRLLFVQAKNGSTDPVVSGALSGGTNGGGARENASRRQQTTFGRFNATPNARNKRAQGTQPGDASGGQHDPRESAASKKTNLAFGLAGVCFSLRGMRS